MRKKTLVILFILSNAVFVVGLVDIFVANILAAPVVSHCTTSCTSSDLLRDPSLLIGSVVLVVCYAVSLVLGITVLIGALVKQAKQQQWAWFVCTFLFGFLPLFGDIYLLIYLVAVPETPQQQPPLLPQQ
jgi:hypothetical protein